jgi:hypothetical protein
MSRILDPFQSLIYSLILLFTSLAVSTRTEQVDWNALNSTIGGKLQVAVPLARPCFQLAVDVAADETQCAEVVANYLDHGTFQ